MREQVGDPEEHSASCNGDCGYGPHSAGTARPALDEIHAHLAGQFAKWQMPNAVEWTDALPLTATGKVSKLALRRRFAEARAGAGADSGAGA